MNRTTVVSIVAASLSNSDLPADWAESLVDLVETAQSAARKLQGPTPQYISAR